MTEPSDLPSEHAPRRRSKKRGSLWHWAVARSDLMEQLADQRPKLTKDRKEVQQAVGLETKDGI
ncbi:hypothetical protein [Rhodococcus sp. 105337]|uniref:hypothetical protein n=1 Tax=Rhodococcus sp. 105337 TaxID=2725310 RepID=UPI00146C0E23|nr:hypothetical protein [Rhodococcus sp. 105337]NME80853.1 hypothetical protein [Rhodococcus sp. 105337]